MNSERHYPQAFKLAMVALLAFDVFTFFGSPDLMVRLYCAIMFVAILNGWAAAEDDSVQYSDLFLLDDAICSAMYFIILLELRGGSYEHFWLYSCIIFLMYALWNKLIQLQRQAVTQTLHKYIVCDVVACVYSLFAFAIVEFCPLFYFARYVQFIGMSMWFAVLLVWYYDFYVRTYLSSNQKSEKWGEPLGRQQPSPKRKNELLL